MKLKAQMSGEAEIHFSTKWSNLILTDRDTEIDLNQVERISAEDIENVIALCPEVKKITTTKHYYLKNDMMIALTDKYPEIEFVWMVCLKGRYRLPSNCTAYSTLNGPDEPEKLRSGNLDALQYVHGLKALDLGHNDITDLDWLQYCPDLELLILSDNKKINVTGTYGAFNTPTAAALATPLILLVTSVTVVALLLPVNALPNFCSV